MTEDSPAKSEHPAPAGAVAPGLPASVPVQIDLREFYAYLKGQPTVEVQSSHYANYAVATFGPRDAWIDFFQLPGIPVEGRNTVPATRVYLAHINAVKLAEAILQTYKQVKTSGTIEPLP
jgi:hypothetical protein